MGRHDRSEQMLRRNVCSMRTLGGTIGLPRMALFPLFSNERLRALAERMCYDKMC